MQEQFERMRDVYLRVAEIKAPEERRKCLSEACAGDTELQARVQEMLDLESKAEGLFQPLHAQGAMPGTKEAGATGLRGQTAEAACTSGEGRSGSGPADGKAQEGPGTLIGRYKLLELIGEGGFGAVYMADQQEPVHRRVALKIIKLGMDTHEVIARFDAERQALALMDHPGVARVLDAGSTASGRPYFVMELVRGSPITDFCDRNRLTPRERIELFISVCHAVQHAHSKGIIHRDLKPSNILVTDIDDKLVPKIIDFGIAKAVQAPLTQKTLFTRFGQMVGTPVYMSPEHIAGTDVDTRTDIYSLGVILYELLTGKPPFELAQLREGGHLEMIRIIQEQDPPRPSTRLTTLGQELTAVAQHRNVHPRRLSELLRGDLDWITMRALQKNRTRRYETPLALAEDLERHLTHQPVSAGPPSVSYRCWKFMRRHRYGVTAAAAVTLSLIAGLILATSGLMQARREREHAVAAEIRAEGERRVAQVEAQRARAKELRARQVSYASDVSLAAHALEASNLGRALALLKRHVGPNGTNDLRGWEWRYLWQQCQSAELFQFGQASNSVLSLSATSDGTLVIAADLDGTVRVWDMQSRKLLLERERLSQVVTASPDGKSFAAGDGTIRDLETGDVVRRLPGTIGLKKMVYSKDGSLLLGLGTDHLFIYDCKDWKLARCYAGFPGGSMHVGGVVVSPKNEWAAVGIEDGRIIVVEVATGKILRSWQAHTDRVTALALSPDGELLASGAGFADDQVKLWKVHEGSPVDALKGHRAWVTTLAFSGNGGLLASASADQNIRLWDTRTRGCIGVLKGNLAEVWGLVMLPDNRTLISAAKDGSIKAWRIAPAKSSASVNEIEADSRRISPRGIGFSITAAELIGITTQGTVGRWSLPSLKFIDSITALSTNNALLSSSPELGWVATADTQGALKFLNLRNQEVKSVENTARVLWMGFASNAKRFFTLDGNLTVNWYEVGAERPLSSWKAGKPGQETVGSACVSADGKYMAVGARDILIYDPSTGKLVAEIAAHKYFTDAVAFSPDSSTLATGSMDGTAKLWQVGTWQNRGMLTGHLLGVHSVAFSPDGKRLATGSLSNEAVKLWDLVTMQEVLNLPSPGDMMSNLVFSPDSRHLLAFGNVNGLRCWSAPTFPELPANPLPAPEIEESPRD